MDAFVKKESLDLLSNMQASNQVVIDKITYLIRGDYPNYINCIKEELKVERESNAKLLERMKVLEKDVLYKNIVLSRVENELSHYKKSKSPIVNRLR